MFKAFSRSVFKAALFTSFGCFPLSVRHGAHQVHPFDHFCTSKQVWCLLLRRDHQQRLRALVLHLRLRLRGPCSFGFRRGFGFRRLLFLRHRLPRGSLGLDRGRVGNPVISVVARAPLVPPTLQLRRIPGGAWRLHHRRALPSEAAWRDFELVGCSEVDSEWVWWKRWWKQYVWFIAPR